MASNPANQSLKDQFLYWRRDMEAKQEEHADEELRANEGDQPHRLQGEKRRRKHG